MIQFIPQTHFFVLSLGMHLPSFAAVCNAPSGNDALPKIYPRRENTMNTLIRFFFLILVVLSLVLSVDSTAVMADGTQVIQKQKKDTKKGRKRDKKQDAEEADDESASATDDSDEDDDADADDEKKDADDESDDADDEDDEDDDDEDAKGKDDKKDKAKKPAKKAQTVKMSGSFVASEAVEVMRRPEEWTTMRVLSAVEHGEKVRLGETLVELDAEKLDLAIKDYKHDVELAEISLKQAEKSLELLERSTPIKLDAAERAEKRASDELKRFLTVGRDSMVEAAEFSLQNAKNFLDYQSEELKQLEAMYEADDLTEETEEIVLKRTRNTVKTAEFSLERAKLSYDREMKMELPRTEHRYQVAVKEAAIELARAKETIPAALEAARLKLAKQRLSMAKSETKLKRMLEDRKTMTIKSPAKGVVYYGQCKKGKWSDSSTLATSLRKGGSLKSGQVFMTIVKMRPLHITTAVTEKDLRHIEEGLEVSVKATAFPDLELTGEIEEVSAIPVASGRFAVTVSVDLPKDTKVVPGMSCSVEYEVPSDEDDSDDEDSDDDEDDEADEKDSDDDDK